MSATSTEPAAECWCCGASSPGDRVVRLGNHPEVVLCLGCARLASKRAAEIEDADRSEIGRRARDSLRAARRAVVARGWHDAPVFGPIQRRIGRHTP